MELQSTQAISEQKAREMQEYITMLSSKVDEAQKKQEQWKKLKKKYEVKVCFFAVCLKTYLYARAFAHLCVLARALLILMFLLDTRAKQ